MAKKHVNTSALPKGLWLDTPKNVQPEGTYSYALNAVSVSDAGEEGIIANENGNTSVFNIPEDYKMIGAMPKADGGVVIFSCNLLGTRGEIGIQSSNDSYTTVINSTSFDFSSSFQIQSETSLLNGCESVIYFNTPTLYAVNLDNIEQYLLDGETVDTANADGEGWDVSLMKLSPAFTPPKFDNITVNDTGGDLPLGTYQVITSYLDGDLNVIGWMDMSNPAPVTDEPYGGTFTEIDGGTNALFPPTSKSITIELSSVDTSFSYLRIALVASNDGVRTGYNITDIPITSDSIVYTITSLSSAGIEEIPLAELVVDKVIYEAAETLTQHESRLILGNVKEKQIDYAAFQQITNNITSHWFCKEVSGIETVPSYKSPDTFLFYKGYMSDEVYAFGIVYYFKDGYITPVFHIPGRNSNTDADGAALPDNSEPNTWHSRLAPTTGWDDTLYTVGTDVDLSEVKHLGFTDATTDIGYGAGLVPRWMVFNTATRYDTPDSSYFAEGELAYYESSLDYPSSTDCDGNRVYPEGKVRYHKMPDVTLVPHATYTADPDEFTTYPIGIKFDNITFPTAYEDDILGYKIVRVERNNTNTSVVTKGLTARSLYYDIDDTQLIFQTYPYNGHRPDLTPPVLETVNCIHSLDTKFNRRALGSTHYKVDQKFITVPFSGEGEVDYTTGTGATSGDYRSRARFSVGDMNLSYTPSFTNRNVVAQAYVDPDTELDNVFQFKFDNTEQQEVYVFESDDSFPAPSASSEAYMWGGESDDPVYFYYGGLKKYLSSQYGLPTDNQYISVSSSYRTSTNTEEYGGDTFISKFYFRRCSRIKQNLLPEIVFIPVNHDESETYTEKHLMYFFVESTINAGYRHEGTEETEIHYPKSYIGDFDSFVNLEVTINADIDTDLIPNYYAYNTDFSKENDVKNYFMLPSSFVFCYDCNNEFKTRIPYSEVKTSEGTTDQYRIFLANNYRDLQANKGEITNLFTDNNRLYAHTPGTLWYVPTGEQQLSTTVDTVFIGTGGFLAVNPIELKTIKQGYLGSKDKFATVSTEYGTVFVSKDKVFNLSTDGMQEISAIGLRQFFIDNSLQFPKEVFELTGLDYTADSNTASGYGVGYIAAEDSSKHRLILHKRDFRILPALEELYAGIKDLSAEYSHGDIVYNSEDQVFELVTIISLPQEEGIQTYSAIDLNDPELFENTSYTISYDLKNNHWVSFHTYLPNFMYNTAEKLYTYLIDGSDVWRHDSNTYQEFYDTKRDHIVEFTVTDTPLNASVAKSFGYISKATANSDTYRQSRLRKDKTFTAAWIYNDSQSSGKVDIINPESPYNPIDYISYSPTSVSVDLKEGVWKFNAVRDYVTQDSIFPVASSAWDDISADYPIDKVPTPLSLDTAKSQYEVAKFRDTYISVRLYNLPIHDNYRLVTQYLYNNSKYSTR